MFQGAPANNEWLELYQEPAYAQIVGLVGFNAVPRTVEVQLDVTVLSAVPAAVDIILFGKAVGWRFLFTDASATTLVTAGKFTTTRGATTKNATNSFTQGKRVILLGKDDGATVNSSASGSAGTAATWTTAQGAAPLTTDTNPFRLGYDGTNFTQLKLHELWVRVNGIVCCHIRPKRLYVGTTTIPDLSGYGNDLTISGTEGTNFRFGSIWNEEPAFSGKEALS